MGPIYYVVNAKFIFRISYKNYRYIRYYFVQQNIILRETYSTINKM